MIAGGQAFTVIKANTSLQINFKSQLQNSKIERMKD
jgi:hypothetical protein